MLPKSLRPLLPYLKRYRWGYVAGTLCVFLTNGIWILFPLVLGKAADDLHQGVTRHKLLVYAGLLLAIAVTKGIFQFLTRWIVIGVSRDIEFDLRNDLFARLEGLSYSYYQRNRTGDIMARATNDLNAVRICSARPSCIRPIPSSCMAGGLAFMISISPRLTFYTFLPLPAASIVIQYFGRRIHDRFERIQAMFSDISARAQENFSGARLIRAYVQEERRDSRLRNREPGIHPPQPEAGAAHGHALAHARIDAGLRRGAGPVAGRTRSAQRTRSASANSFRFSTYMMQLTWPIIALGWVINIFQRGTASLIRINEIMQEQPEIKDAPGAQDREVTGEIEFRGLNFSYEGKQVLHDVNLTHPRRQAAWRSSARPAPARRLWSA